MSKYTVLETGKPYATSIPEGAWKVKSTHSSERAAWRAITRYEAHLDQGSWDNHYKVIDPDGNTCDWLTFYAKEWDRDFNKTRKGR